MSWEEGDLHGRHVSAAALARTAITWTPERPHGQVRVRDYTCECKPVVYELCQSGGVTFIRKMTRKGEEATIEEYIARSGVEVHAVWRRLLDLA
jgi:hypothetical protein